MRRPLHIGCFRMVMAVLLPLFFACNTFEYGFDESEVNKKDRNKSELSFEFPDATMVPEQVTVLMSRKVNNLNYNWTLDPSGLVVKDDQTSVASQIIPNGDYYLIAFNKYSDFYSITDYSDFEDGSVRMKDLYAKVPSMTAEDYGLGEELLDLNQYSGYIAHADESLPHFVERSLLLPYSAGVVTLALEDLTREYTFILSVEAERSVTIRKIIAVLSGIPAQVQLMSGFVSRNETSKVAFEFKQKERKHGAQGMVGYEYEGKVRSFGLFSSRDTDMTTGPGIMQIFLTTSVDGDTDEVERTFYAGINMKGTIDETVMMIPSEDKSGYRAVSQSDIGPIRVNAVLKVMKSHIEAEETDGTVVWFENDAEISPEV